MLMIAFCAQASRSRKERSDAPLGFQISMEVRQVHVVIALGQQCLANGWKIPGS